MTTLEVTASPAPAALAAPADRRTAERVTQALELAAAKSTIRDLQGELSVWAPLEAVYEAEMTGRKARRFKVESRQQWVADLVRRMGGDWLRGEDGRDVVDHLDND